MSKPVDLSVMMTDICGLRVILVTGVNSSLKITTFCAYIMKCKNWQTSTK